MGTQDRPVSKLLPPTTKPCSLPRATGLKLLEERPFYSARQVDGRSLKGLVC